MSFKQRTITLADIYQQLDIAVVDTAELEKTIIGLASLHSASSQHISFCSSPSFLSELASTQAGAVLIKQEFLPSCPAHTHAIVVANPYLMYAKLSQIIKAKLQTNTLEDFQHPTAVVSDSAIVGRHSMIGANCVIGDNTVIGEGCIIEAGAVVAENCQLGESCIIKPNATINAHCHIGNRCIIHSGAVVGADGFGFAPTQQGYVKIEQLGGVKIGDDVEIGACTAVDRGALDDTIIGNGVKIDNQVQIAHNVIIGDNTAIAGQAGIAGSTKIGKWCTIAGGVGIVGHIEITDNVHLTGMTMVSKSILTPGSYSSGTSMQPTSVWRKNAVRFSRLDELIRQLKK